MSRYLSSFYNCHSSRKSELSSRISVKMSQVRRIAQIVHLKPSAVEACKECHANVWPEVLKQIHDSNIRDCTWLIILSASLGFKGMEILVGIKTCAFLNTSTAMLLLRTA